MGTATIEVDPSDVQSISVDPSEVSAVETAAAPAKPGFWERAYETSGAKGLIDTAKQRDADLRAMYSRVGDHLENGDYGGALSEFAKHAGKVALQTGEDMPAVAILRSQASQIPKAIAAAKAGDYSTAVGRGLAAVTPLVGPAAADTGDKLGTDVGEGNWKGAAGDLTGFVGPLVAGKAAQLGAEALDTPTGQAVSSVVKAAAKQLPKSAVTRIPYVGKVAADVLKAGVEAWNKPPAEALNAPVTNFMHGPEPAPAELPEGFTPRAAYQEPAGSAGNPFKAPAAPSTPAEAPIAAPGATVAPEAEDLEGVTSAQTENAGTGPDETSPAETLAQILSKKASPAELKSMLNDALGGKAPAPLRKGVSLRNQNQPAAAVPAETPLPEGFEPVDSTALKGFKYDPTTREFESITQGGQHYIHGDVSPEDAMEFEAADSKGKAWQKLRAGAPLVGKVLNGKRVSVTPGTMGAPGEVIAKSEAGMSPLDQKVANLQDFIAPRKAPAAAPPAAPGPAAQVPAAAAAPDLTTDWSKALADVQAKQPANVAAARANPDLESGVEVAPGDADAELKAARIQNAKQVISNPDSTFEEIMQARKNLLDTTDPAGPADQAAIEARAQAAKNRPKPKPRTDVVEAPTKSRKSVQSVEELAAIRKAQRNRQ